VLGVVLPDIDGALRRPTLDAAEDALRLAFRIAGWTVSGATGEHDQDAPSEGAGVATSRSIPTQPQVVVETRDADHHALQALVAWDAEGFWRAEEEFRRPLRLPPHTPAIRVDVPESFPDPLAQVRANVAPGDDVVGPLPLGGARRALLIRSQDRIATLEALWPLRELASRKGLDLRVDVDPVDLG
jgi:primosomal protein N'